MSFKITSFEFDGKIVNFSKNTYHDSYEHSYTIITGKNAVGKSRLLEEIILRFLNTYDSYWGDINNNLPKNIIAISNIRHDRFPLNKKKFPNYQYIGSKNISSSTVNDKNYIFKMLICNEEINLNSICSTFRYLDFDPDVKFKLTSTKPTYINTDLRINLYLEVFEKYLYLFENKISSEMLDEIFKFIHSMKNFKNKENEHQESILFKLSNKLNLKETTDKKEPASKNTKKTIKDFFNSIPDNIIFFFDCIVKVHLDKRNINEFFIKNLIKISFFHKIKRAITLSVSFKEDFFYNEEEILLLRFLLNNSLFKIRSVELFPLSLNKHARNGINFLKLSSGQQALFNVFLGISSVIDDNSLICIDEPEVNLHPEWQTEFIIKLQNIFKNYHGCHFIIATHSPQIVSGLTSSNGYVIDLENNITYSTDEYSKKSADFQLAKIFSTPGHNNEYLIRIGLILLSKLTQKLDFTFEDKNNLKFLNDAINDLPENDAVYYLIKQINALVEV